MNQTTTHRPLNPSTSTRPSSRNTTASRPQPRPAHAPSWEELLGRR